MATVLTINGGSSSIRFSFYDAQSGGAALVAGKVERMGSSDATLTVTDTRKGSEQRSQTRIEGTDRPAAIDFFMDWLTRFSLFADVKGIGHRVVHGMHHFEPERITPALVDELKRITPYDPEHLPSEIQLMETLHRVRAEVPQVACFDTAFHQSMPQMAKTLPIPRRYLAKGVQRYGFHGLSYTYLMAELKRQSDAAATKGRIILAHLGNGASLAAVRDGRCIDTSMSFTPTAGLVMSTRTGDLDPGIVSFLSATESMSVADFQKMVNHESGLLGISETSSDVRDLLAREADDSRAAEAVAIFCYQVKKWIGSFAAALGGLDTLVFAGGIGENAPVIRARICEGLPFLGVELHEERNARGASVVSTDSGRVVVRVIRTDEESVIAAATRHVLGLTVN